jgi:membrane-associated protein
LIDPILRPVFGPDFRVAKHVEKVILVVIAVSVMPIAWKSWKGYRARKTKSPIPAKTIT